MKFRHFAIAIAACGARTATTPAETPRHEAEPVRLYTNADLEAFGPPESKPGDPLRIDDDGSGWDLVLEVLARERDRIEAERRLALERESERQEEERSRLIQCAPLILPGTGPPGWMCRGSRHARSPAARLEEQRDGRLRPRAVLWPRPVPIHARPSVFETGHGGSRTD